MWTRSCIYCELQEFEPDLGIAERWSSVPSAPTVICGPCCGEGLGWTEGNVFCRPPAGPVTSMFSVAVSVACALADRFLESGACVYNCIVFLCSKNGRAIRSG